MNNQDKYDLVRGRVSASEARALCFDHALIRLSYIYEDTVKAYMYDGPFDIPIDVAAHVAFLTYMCPPDPNEFPALDLALIKARLLADYGYLSAAPRFAFVLGLLKEAGVLTAEEVKKCNVIICEEAVAATREGRKI